MPTINMGLYINEQWSAKWDSFLHEIAMKSWRKKNSHAYVYISVYVQLINCSIHKNCANENQESNELQKWIRMSINWFAECENELHCL